MHQMPGMLRTHHCVSAHIKRLCGCRIGVIRLYSGTHRLSLSMTISSVAVDLHTVPSCASDGRAECVDVHTQVGSSTFCGWHIVTALSMALSRRAGAGLSELSCV